MSSIVVPVNASELRKLGCVSHRDASEEEGNQSLGEERVLGEKIGSEP
jgi:hypothetical protein